MTADESTQLDKKIKAIVRQELDIYLDRMLDQMKSCQEAVSSISQVDSDKQTTAPD
jgi:hypothetical protein